MTATFLLAAAMLASAEPPAMMTVEGNVDRVDVAYEDLAAGRNEQAIARILANREIDADDPAALINLGTAHARLGHVEKAQALFRAAIVSRTPCSLQLADGRWIDSRRAARIATAMLASKGTLALR